MKKEINVRCFTKDGTEKKPEDTKVPYEICEFIFNIAENVRKRLEQEQEAI